MGWPKSGQERTSTTSLDARRSYKKACRDASNAAIRGGYANKAGFSNAMRSVTYAA